jgi:hypothetical protein
LARHEIEWPEKHSQSPIAADGIGSWRLISPDASLQQTPSREKSSGGGDCFR